MFIALSDAIWDARMTSSCKLVCLAIGKYINGYGDEAFPSEEEIAKVTGLSSRTVRTCVHWLEDSDVLKIVRKPRPGSKWPTNHYQFKKGLRNLDRKLFPLVDVNTGNLEQYDRKSFPNIPETVADESSSDSSMNPHAAHSALMADAPCEEVRV